MRKLILKGATPKEFALSGEMTIGSQPGNKLVLKSPKVEANHAKITKVGEHTFVEDLNTAAGVLVNGKKISRSALKKGDAIDIGGVTFTYDDDGKPETVNTKAATAPAKPGAAVAPARPPSTAAGTPTVKPTATQKVAPITKTPAPQAGVKPPPSKTPAPQPGVKAPAMPSKTPSSVPAAKGPVPTAPAMSAKLPAAGGLSAKLPSLTTTPARPSGSLTPPGAKPVPTTGLPSAGASAAKMLAAGNAAISVRTKAISTSSSASVSSARKAPEPPSFGKKMLIAGGAGVLILGLLVVALLVFRKKPEPEVAGPSQAEVEALQRLKKEGPKDPKDLQIVRKTIFACKKWSEVEALLGPPALKVPGNFMLWDADKGTTTHTGHEFRAYYVNDSLALRPDSQVVSVLLFETESDETATCMGMRIHALKETPPLANAISKQEEYQRYQEHLKQEAAAKAAEEKRAAEEKKHSEAQEKAEPPRNGEAPPPAPAPQTPARSF